MMIENTEFWQDKIRREKALELLAKYHEYERTHKMYSKKLNNSTIVSAKSPERLEEVINELKNNGSI